MKKNSIIFIWWLGIMGLVEVAALTLDGSRHLPWGLSGIILLKASYLACGIILLLRYLSFSKQKGFESMLEAYNRISTFPWLQGSPEGHNIRKLCYYGGLIVLSLGNFLLLFSPKLNALRTSVVLDTLIWLMALRWVTRSQWLSVGGRKERLKEALDNARSRHGDHDTETIAANMKPSRFPPRLFLFLGALFFVYTLGISALRWNRAPLVNRLNDLKSCLEESIHLGTAAFHQTGTLINASLKHGCLEKYSESLEPKLGFDQGSVYLKVTETAQSDYFGSGFPGDQSLTLDARGRFRTNR